MLNLSGASVAATTMQGGPGSAVGTWSSAASATSTSPTSKWPVASENPPCSTRVSSSPLWPWSGTAWPGGMNKSREIPSRSPPITHCFTPPPTAFHFGKRPFNAAMTGAG